MKTHHALARGSFFMLLVAFVLLISCNTEDPAPNVLDAQVKTDAELRVIKSNLASRVATNLAAHLQNKSLKDFIKSQALKKFDGDYNFLVGKVLDEQIEMNLTEGRAGLTFREIISNSAVASESRSLNDLTDSLNAFYPLLQIYITQLEEGMVENWNTDENPLVAFLPQDDSETVLAFDAQGNTHTLSLTERPDQMVILLKENERLIGLDNSYLKEQACDKLLALTPYYEVGDEKYYFYNDYAEALNSCVIASLPKGEEAITSENGRLATCSRDGNSNKDFIKRFKFKSSTTYNGAKDGWADGYIELRMHVFFARANGTLSTLHKGWDIDEDDVEDLQWKNLGAEIVTWDPSIYGDAMLYRWYESDGGGYTNKTVTHTSVIDGVTYTVSTTYSVSSDRYDLFESIAEYCDPAGPSPAPVFTYDTGRIYFELTN